MVETELLRSVIAPVGHGLWTAIVGGVLFSASTRDHFTLTRRLILTYLGVSLLHALWDSMHVIALTLTLLLTEGETYQPTPNGWLVNPSSSQVGLFTVLEWTGLAVVSLVGIVWLAALLRSARRVPQAPTPTSGWRVPIRPLDT